MLNIVINRIIRDYNSRNTLGEIAKIHNCSRGTIHKILVNSGIVIRSNGETRTGRSRSKSMEERFWNKVIKLSNGCWLFGKSLDIQSSIYSLSTGGVIAYRYSYELHNNEIIPEGLCVCHTCDNPGCINPDHLFLGTHKENMEDRNNKGRSRGGSNSGIKNPRSKLTIEQVAEIQTKYIKGKPGGSDGRFAGNAKQLALEFKVSTDTIHKVAQHRRYK